MAVREDSLVLDGGETIKAEGAIDARGAATLSTLDLLYEASLERDYRLKAPHRVRPAGTDRRQCGAGRRAALRPLHPGRRDRLILADVCLSERAQPDSEAGARLDAYVKARGWQKKAILAERATARPLPFGGTLRVFWRLGGHRGAKLGLRGGSCIRSPGDCRRRGGDGDLLTAQRRFFGRGPARLFAAERCTFGSAASRSAPSPPPSPPPRGERRAIAESLCRSTPR